MRGQRLSKWLICYCSPRRGRVELPPICSERAQVVATWAEMVRFTCSLSSISAERLRSRAAESLSHFPRQGITPGCVISAGPRANPGQAQAHVRGRNLNPETQLGETHDEVSKVGNRKCGSGGYGGRNQREHVCAGPVGQHQHRQEHKKKHEGLQAREKIGRAHV